VPPGSFYRRNNTTYPDSAPPVFNQPSFGDDPVTPTKMSESQRLQALQLLASLTPGDVERLRKDLRPSIDAHVDPARPDRTGDETRRDDRRSATPENPPAGRE
jgi:hypothetical protein